MDEHEDEELQEPLDVPLGPPQGAFVPVDVIGVQNNVPQVIAVNMEAMMNDAAAHEALLEMLGVNLGEDEDEEDGDEDDEEDDDEEDEGPDDEVPLLVISDGDDDTGDDDGSEGDGEHDASQASISGDSDSEVWEGANGGWGLHDPHLRT